MKKHGYILLLVVVALFSCSTPQSSTSSQEKYQQHYLALGDSYTVGEMVATELTFPYLLVKDFNQNGHAFAPPRVVATTGWRTDELLQAIEPLEEPYDLVSVLIGVNNQYQGKDIGQFRREIQLILEKAISLSKKGATGVFAYSIPDYSVMPIMRGENLDKITSEIKLYNHYFEETCKALGIQFYNITPYSRMAQQDTQLIANDKLHPSGKMYQMWVQKTARSIREQHLK